VIGSAVISIFQVNIRLVKKIRVAEKYPQKSLSPNLETRMIQIKLTHLEKMEDAPLND